MQWTAIGSILVYLFGLTPAVTAQTGRKFGGARDELVV